MPDPSPADPPLVTRPADVPLVVRPKVRPGFQEATILTVAFFAATVLAVVAVVAPAVIYDGATGGAAADTGGKLPPTAAAAAVGAIVAGYAAGGGFAVLVLRRLVGRGWPAELGLDRFPVGGLLLALVAFPAFGVGGELLAGCMTVVFGSDPLAAELQRSVADLARSYPPAAAVFAIGVCPGVVEELFCRGLLGRGLVGRYGPWAGVALTSIFFALLHVYPPAALPVYAAMGAALHFAYLKTRSLWVPIALHALNNGYAALAANGVIADPTAAAIEARPAAVAAAVAATLLAAGVAASVSGWRAVAAGVLAAVCSAGLVGLLLG